MAWIIAFPSDEVFSCDILLKHISKTLIDWALVLKYDILGHIDQSCNTKVFLHAAAVIQPVSSKQMYLDLPVSTFAIICNSSTSFSTCAYAIDVPGFTGRRPLASLKEQPKGWLRCIVACRFARTCLSSSHHWIDTHQSHIFHPTLSDQNGDDGGFVVRGQTSIGQSCVTVSTPILFFCLCLESEIQSHLLNALLLYFPVISVFLSGSLSYLSKDDVLKGHFQIIMSEM